MVLVDGDVVANRGMVPVYKDIRTGSGMVLVNGDMVTNRGMVRVNKIDIEINRDMVLANKGDMGTERYDTCK